MTHKQAMDLAKPARPCNANDIIIVSEGIQCGNCLAVSPDHGATWSDLASRIRDAHNRRSAVIRGE